MEPFGAMLDLASGQLLRHKPPGIEEPGKGTITVSIIECDRLICGSLKALVGSSPKLRCISTHFNTPEALPTLPSLRPDVLLLDGRLLRLHGAGLISKLRASSPATQVLVTTTFDLGSLLFEAVRAGARGDLPKTTPVGDLIQVIQWVQAGGSAMSLPLARRVASYFQHRKAPENPALALTDLEQNILAAMARGNSCAAVASEFGLALSRLFSLLRGICDKLDTQLPVT